MAKAAHNLAQWIASSSSRVNAGPRREHVLPPFRATEKEMEDLGPPAFDGTHWHGFQRFACCPPYGRRSIYGPVSHTLCCEPLILQLLRLTGGVIVKTGFSRRSFRISLVETTHTQMVYRNDYLYFDSHARIVNAYAELRKRSPLSLSRSSELKRIQTEKILPLYCVRIYPCCSWS